MKFEDTQMICSVVQRSGIKTFLNYNFDIVSEIMSINVFESESVIILNILIIPQIFNFSVSNKSFLVNGV